MTGGAAERLTFYRPAEVADRLGCSAWWVKEQARRRRVPYCWIGGSYRFTEEHVAEIARICERRPDEHAGHGTGGPGRARRVVVEESPALVLRARVPKRARQRAARPDAA